MTTAQNFCLGDCLASEIQPISVWHFVEHHDYFRKILPGSLPSIRNSTDIGLAFRCYPTLAKKFGRGLVFFIEAKPISVEFLDGCVEVGGFKEHLAERGALSGIS